MINISVLNNQPPEKQHLDFNGNLDVVSIFKTIQGEGPLAGTPSIFVRLAGCNLRCDWCDTDYTTNRQIYTVDNLLKEIKNKAEFSNITQIVITGGEPFRQYIIPFIREALYQDFKVQIETNGTLFYNEWLVESSWTEAGFDWLVESSWTEAGFDWFTYKDSRCYLKDVSIVCSPKTEKINKDLEKNITAWKYILHYENVCEKDGLPTKSLGYGGKPARPDWDSYLTPIVYVQPEDTKCEETNKKNIEACLQTCYKYGYILSLQTHKILDLE